MLESGCVSVKNEVNIMMKNIVDIVLGGLTYWIFGYGMSFGRGPLTNSFIAIGDFLLDPPAGDPLMGPIFGTFQLNKSTFIIIIGSNILCVCVSEIAAAFLFQLSFATTATTIVSGAMAERCVYRSTRSYFPYKRCVSINL